MTPNGPTSDTFVDKDGDTWTRGRDRNEVILRSPSPLFEDNPVQRSELEMYERWPTTMATCAHTAFEVLWPSEPLSTSAVDNGDVLVRRGNRLVGEPLANQPIAQSWDNSCGPFGDDT